MVVGGGGCEGGGSGRACTAACSSRANLKTKTPTHTLKKPEFSDVLKLPAKTCEIKPSGEESEPTAAAAAAPASALLLI